MLQRAVSIITVLVAGIVLAGCSRQANVADTAAQAQQQFDFQNNFWVNLHHVLYEEAVRRHPQSNGVPAQSLLGAVRLTPDELALWETAVSYYDNEFVVARRDLVFDDGLKQIKLQLSGLEEKSPLAGAGLPQPLVAVLQPAAPVYAQHWWPEHRARNDAQIVELVPLLSKYAAPLQQQLTAAYRSDWPGGPQQRLRVDVVYYAYWAGAYTFDSPPVITLGSSEDERATGMRKLELLFHEASHTFFAKVDTDIAVTAQRLGRQSDQLWHATLFFTTGEVVRRTLEKDGVTDYVPYAYYNGLFAADSEWNVYARALEKHWGPYLGGAVDYQTALNNLVTALPAGGGTDQ